MAHSSSQRGIAAAAIVIIVAVVIIGAGAAYYFSSQTAQQGAEKEMMEQPEAMLQKDTSPAPIADDAMVKKDEETSMVKYSGTVLAGTSAPLLDFNKADFDAAVKTDKVVVLYFFANWCPICIKEFPIMQSAFNELTTNQVVGFRVNYNDNQTDADEKALAREHGVAYQHTKVLLKNGRQILKSPESWAKDRYLAEITKAIGQ